jgi:hypothetical protein
MGMSECGLRLTDFRYIQLQEEYIKDEQRYGKRCSVEPGIGADIIQESQTRTSAGARRDQAYSECPLGYWPVHGGHRSEVGSVSRAYAIYLTRVVPVSCNHQRDPIMLCGSSRPLTASCLSHHPPLPSTVIQTLLLISSLPRQIPPLQCLVQMRSQMSPMQMLAGLICRSRKSVKRSSYRKNDISWMEIQVFLLNSR